MNLFIETELENDGRWIAAIPELPGVALYGKTEEEAVRRVKALAFRVLAEQLENGLELPAGLSLFEVAA